MAEGIIRHPSVRDRDIDALVDIYTECFPDRTEEVFGGVHRRTFIADYLRFYLSWDPENNWVYGLDEKILGFVIGPCRDMRAGTIFVHCQVLRWLWHFATGRYGLPLHIVKLYLESGIAFNRDPAIRRLWGRPYIHIFAVTPSAQGMGIGSTLIQWTLDQYRKRGVDFCWLVVQGKNQRGFKFYERFGFRFHEKIANGDVIMVWRDVHEAKGHCQRR
ncbi:MAG: GNAT family N-acetyltransferase [candidate division NC10 bacterium]|nr:GNAT family N-acetyltransferase [candidate division NC10 bacterium]MDE2321223.1 GNAT family N-acetyltransferase [candidate division NC10 bacterium]